MGVRISLPVQKRSRNVEAFAFPEAGIQGKSLPGRKQQTMNKISTYFRESYKELTEKVTWPNWTQLQQSTMIVLGATLLITAVVAAMDFVAAGGLNLIYKMFK
jgi:preprotein translocase subunit SecE